MWFELADSNSKGLNYENIWGNMTGLFKESMHVIVARIK